MKALQAFVRINIAFGMDRLHHAFIGATLAGIATLSVALEPIKHSRALFAIYESQ